MVRKSSKRRQRRRSRKTYKKRNSRRVRRRTKRRRSRRRSFGAVRKMYFGMKAGTGKGGMGPGYKGATSFQNGYVPYFSGQEPFIQAPKWWYPIAGEQFQSMPVYKY